MWTRRRFLENLSSLPLIGGFIGATAPLASAESAESAASARSAAAKRDFFRELGVRPFINAAGTYTAMTASLMPDEVIDAIEYASKHYVMLDELHDRVGERIAKLLKAEAAMVTSGAASALTLGTAAVLTGPDRQKIVDLPDLTNMKNEVIIQKSHRFGYDHAVRNCGVRLVEVETREELERAVNPKTAMMLFYNNNNPVGQVRDVEFVQLGKKHAVPTFNDAAADVPPVENLWKYTEMGFDLVTFSGGKGMRGPQSAGLLLGRKDLIAAARLNAPPNGNTVGRGMKVNKEEMLGMLVALEMYVERDHARERTEFDKRAETIRAAATSVPGVDAEVFVPEVANHVPHIRISWDAAARGITAEGVVKALRDGEPSIGTRSEGDALVVGVWMMRSNEEKVVARRLREVLTRAATAASKTPALP
jgi:L-seryl-tRNA(Ser) seleniumtransferase